MSQKELIQELTRLGCHDDEYTIRVEETEGGEVQLSDECSDEPTEVMADELCALLKRLPEGSPTDEGEEGSVWEVILTLSQDGPEVADQYLKGLGL